jgi:hypothetical protein
MKWNLESEISGVEEKTGPFAFLHHACFPLEQPSHNLNLNIVTIFSFKIFHARCRQPAAAGVAKQSTGPSVDASR